MKNLIDAGVGCNACLVASFSSDDGIEQVKKNLSKVHPGILKSSRSKPSLFSKVQERLEKYGLKPTRAKRLRSWKSGMKAISYVASLLCLYLVLQGWSFWSIHFLLPIGIVLSVLAIGMVFIFTRRIAESSR